MFQARNLTKRYGRLTALSDVSFSVRPGEVLGLIGPNGSGKTTLFECLGGVLPLDAGSLVHDGQPMTDRARASTLFYLPDSIVPWPAQSVRWAIEFTLGFFDGRAQLRDEVMQRLDIAPLLDSTIGSLSKGQRKRALLAIGLLMPQPLLLADEPFDGLDLRQSRDVAQTLRSYAVGGAGRCSCRSTRSRMRRACAIGSSCLSGGTIRGEGTFEQLASQAAARGAVDQAISKRCSLPSRKSEEPPQSQRITLATLRRLRWLLEKEYRELVASRAWWVLLLAMGPLVGVDFMSAVRTYGEASGLNGTTAGVGEAFSPLIGIWAPTFSACEVAAVFLLPFVAIRLVSGDRQSGALKIEMQHPMPAIARIGAKGHRAARRLAGRVACAAGRPSLLWKSYGGSIYAPELATVVFGHVLNAGLTIALATAAAALTEHPSTAAILTLSATVGTWILNFVAAVQGGIWERRRRLHAAGDGRAVSARPRPPRRRADRAGAGRGRPGARGLWLRLGVAVRRRVQESIVLAALRGRGRVRGQRRLAELGSVRKPHELVLRGG